MRRSLEFAILAFAVIVLPWLIVSVAANIQTVSAPVAINQNVTCFACPNATSSANFPFQAGQTNPEPFQLALVSIAAICVALSYLAWRRGVRYGRADNLWNIPAMLLMIGMLYLFLSVGKWFGSRLQIGTGTVESPFPLWYLSLSLVVIAGGTSLIWALRRSGVIHVKPAPTSGSSESSLTRVLQGAISSLRTGNDPRSAIVRCYGSMVELLQRLGVSDSPSMTAREFEAACQRAFSVRRDPIHRLTVLFERARYSDEDIGAQQVSEAEGVLTELRDSVGGGLLVP